MSLVAQIEVKHGGTCQQQDDRGNDQADARMAALVLWKELPIRDAGADRLAALGRGASRGLPGETRGPLGGAARRVVIIVGVVIIVVIEGPLADVAIDPALVLFDICETFEAVIQAELKLLQTLIGVSGKLCGVSRERSNLAAQLADRCGRIERVDPRLQLLGDEIGGLACQLRPGSPRDDFQPLGRRRKRGVGLGNQPAQLIEALFNTAHSGILGVRPLLVVFEISRQFLQSGFNGGHGSILLAGAEFLHELVKLRLQGLEPLGRDVFGKPVDRGAHGGEAFLEPAPIEHRYVRCNLVGATLTRFADVDAGVGRRRLEGSAWGLAGRVAAALRAVAGRRRRRRLRLLMPGKVSVEIGRQFVQPLAE